MTSCLPFCDETTGFQPPVTRGTLCNVVPLLIQKSAQKKFVCAPLIQGPGGNPGQDGPDGPEGEIFLPINNTSFIDPEYGNDETAEPENLGQPYRTFQAALTNIPAGGQGDGFWQLFLWPGRYDVGTINIPAGIDLEIRGSGPEVTTLVGRILHETESRVTVVDLEIETLNGEPPFFLTGAGSLWGRDLLIERTANNANERSIATTLAGATGEIILRDSHLIYTSSISATAFANNGGRIRLLGNNIEINLTAVSESIRIFNNTGSGLTEVNDNEIRLSFPSIDLDLYAINPNPNGNGRLVVNDNYHTLNSEGYDARFRIYVVGATAGAVGPQPIILARNNEYHFLTTFNDNDNIVSINNSSSDARVKVVDDTFVEPPIDPPRFMPTIVPASSVNPGGLTQHQFNTSNTLATNQGIQLATRTVPTEGFTATDDDYFLLVNSDAITTINFPTPSASYRGKILVVRNEKPDMTAVTITGIDSVAVNEARQYIATLSSWELISVFP